MTVRQEEEAYVCIYSERHGDVILFYHQGGVDVGDVDEKARRLFVEVGGKPNEADVAELLVELAPSKREWGAFLEPFFFYQLTKIGSNLTYFLQFVEFYLGWLGFTKLFLATLTDFKWTI